VITICPQCQLSLAVSASDLRIAHGQVRCGRCASVFNALISLYDTESDAVAPPEPASLPAVTEFTDEQAAATDTSDTRFFEVVVKSTGADPVANTGVFAAAPDAEIERIETEQPVLDQAQLAETQLEEIEHQSAVVEEPPPAIGTDIAELAELAEMADIADIAAETEAPPTDGIDLAQDDLVQAELAQAEGTDLADDIGIPDEPAIPDLAANDPVVEVPLAANDPRIDDIAAANDPVADSPAVDLPVEVERGSTAPIAPDDLDVHVVPQLAAADTPDSQGTAWLPVYDLPEETADDVPQSADELVAARSHGVDIDVGEAVSTIVPPRVSQPAAAAEAELDSHADSSDDDIESLDDAPPRDRRWWAFAAGAGVLALTLAAQLVHFNRDALATWPRISTPLSRFYASIGLPIALRGDLRAYDVRQLGAFAAPDAAGTLTVRASLRNLAPRAQPMPLLRVTLQDRYGNRIASRDLAAAEYQQRPAGTQPWPLIASGARLDTAVQLVDPGGNAVGFELDVCLPGPGGAVRCANDEPARAAR